MEYNFIYYHNSQNTVPKTKAKLKGDNFIENKLQAWEEHQKIKTGKLDGNYWVWPSGLKTHLRFIKEAVMKRRNLPVGFYDEAKRLNLPNLNVLAARAKSLGLKDSVKK